MTRIARLAGGTTLIVAGTAMLVLPGPGLLTIAAGVALMADEVRWARRTTDWAKAKMARLRDPSLESGPDQDGG